jgi:uncharacterized protein (DUF169 family)
MGREKLEAIEKRVRSFLGMNHRLVGIKISEENMDGNHPAAPITFCKVVRQALGGKELVVGMDDLSCPNAELCLGFREPMFVDVGLRIKGKTKTVRIGPLEDADVVLFVLSPEQVMVVSILLGGIKAEFKGEMAICGEAVAKVYNEGEPNVSFLCSGARDLGGFETHEVVLSLPYALFLELPDKMTKFASLSQSVRGEREKELDDHKRRDMQPRLPPCCVCDERARGPARPPRGMYGMWGLSAQLPDGCDHGRKWRGVCCRYDLRCPDRQEGSHLRW